MPQLRCENISCERGGGIVFSGLDITLEPGDICSVGGANGRGKANLIEVIAGLLPPASGGIFWNRQLARDSEDFLRHTVYVGHKNALKQEMTVLENLTHYAALRDTEMLVPAALEYFDLFPF